MADGQFKLISEYTPGGDQPDAIEKLAAGINANMRWQTLLGATGTGKTYTIAQVIQKIQRPTLVIAHNKTLVAQLCSEFREFFPENAVEYFVSYYDYYQPEAYIPQTDTYIEKDSSVNDEINRLRHSSTQSVLERRDVIVVASVSCIYGLGSPEEYKNSILMFRCGNQMDRETVLRRLIDMQFTRNNMELTRGTFRVRGDILEIQPADEEIIIRIEFFGDDIEKITLADPLTGEIIGSRESISVFPASHFVAGDERMARAITEIEQELKVRVAYFTARNELIEAQRIEQRTRFDIEMMKELGYCSGIENYSRFMDGREVGTAPHTLLDYFPEDFMVVIDESHQSLPQIRGMYNGDKARKDILISYGFRLPSAADNRPLKWHEFDSRVKQIILVSATPGPFERENSAQIVEQIIRPTGLIDPEVIIRPTKGQIDDLIEEIRKRVAREERVLVTTLTKKMAEDLTEYLEDLKLKVNYLHSDIKTLERTVILRDLRLGTHDVLVGINLLREGLDLPEVSLVAILDADKEGFLRSETSLIQTIGRAARNVGGQVILYADNITGSMERAIDETNRRRAKQIAYNTEHGITPQTVKKAVRDLIQAEKIADERAEYSVQNSTARLRTDPATLSISQIEEVVKTLEKEMKEAARALNFEYAAELRDEVNELRKMAPVSKIGQDPRAAAKPETNGYTYPRPKRAGRK
jgi:excinuclease ABC subunit B